MSRLNSEDPHDILSKSSQQLLGSCSLLHVLPFVKVYWNYILSHYCKLKSLAATGANELPKFKEKVKKKKNFYSSPCKSVLTALSCPSIPPLASLPSPGKLSFQPRPFVGWFVIRIKLKLLNRFPQNENVGWVLVQNRPHQRLNPDKGTDLCFLVASLVHLLFC